MYVTPILNNINKDNENFKFWGIEFTESNKEP